MLSSKQWNNKASDIKLVYIYSAIKMMHGPINVSTHLVVRKTVCRKPSLQPVLSKHILNIIKKNWLILSITFINRKLYKCLHNQSPFTNPVGPVFWTPTNEKAEKKQRGSRINFNYTLRIWLAGGRVVCRKFHLASFHPATTSLSKIVNCVRRHK